MTNILREQHDVFLRLFLAQEESLRVYVRSLLFSQEEAREVMQEIAVVLWRKFEPAMDSDAFCRWAFGVARMEVLAFKRDRARDRLVFREEVSELLAQTVLDRAPSLEDERRALELCVEKLPADQRELVRAAYAPEARMDHLAAQMGRTAMAVYKTLHRIRLALIECTSQVLASERTT